ncbi:MAG TPA: transcription-repair coupling factor [Anaerohalosphaeraceae bacterium]|nr:transcription-repair coupling factor [Anaerohalosphaeraceae bacterium]HOL88136.1 transcription-repair coupling factor [Anaerohalosphaeraceae bacterium]
MRDGSCSGTHQSMDLGKDKTVRQLLERLRGRTPSDPPIAVEGTWGSFARLLAAYVHQELQRPVLFVSAHIDDADDAGDDLEVFSGRAAETLPVWESPQAALDAADEIGSQRVRIALNLARRQRGGSIRPFLMSASIQALMQPVPSADSLLGGGLTLQVGNAYDIENLAAKLLEWGFEPVEQVDIPGQFARRGGILDIYAAAAVSEQSQEASAAEPIRIEFFGDEIESIRTIDLDTQRSGRSLKWVQIVNPPAQQVFDKSELFFNLLPEETIVFLEEPLELAEVAEVFLSRLEDPRGFYRWESIYQAVRRFSAVEISRFGGGAEALRLDVGSIQELEHRQAGTWKDHKQTLAALLDKARDYDVFLYCENHAEIQRTKEILQEEGRTIPLSFHLELGTVHQGFCIRSLKVIVASHHELFGRSLMRRRVRAIRTASPVDSLLDLTKGDIVVHVSYGIGKYVGMESIPMHGQMQEYLTLEYADKVKIHVPVSQIHLVHKFVGTMPTRPPLSKIGTKKWEQQKQRVAQHVQELAEELLQIQAKRQQMGGFAFGPDTHWQKEFEEAFAYEETPDQLKAAEEIKRDMEAPVPMDRLLCGDVGYGKTELAMRAAFKAVCAGKQVAVLVPTTVLSVQHGRTFAERFADFPVSIAVLNRFTPPAQVRQILSDARQGRLDILIGTHRLLSDDVGFHDLGLLIIDEEQRFGVEHKERLKRFRVNVDILTLTATPIPRTLHMSLLGLRDISSLATPPLDRRSVVTHVCRFDPETIRKAILFELARDGQVFYLYNRVQTIEQEAARVRAILNDPKITVDIVHGQMSKHHLEDAMIRFVTGQTQVLVCSTIIEAGLDIPNANTLIVRDADRFGLAQLHQLRGRVGRYKHRAYAYLLLPESRPISPLAARRLKAIEDFSQLGAGFRIALRDLEIRGAGNLLGPEQSGHIHTVGYEMYCRLLADAVRRLKNEPVVQPPQTVMDLGFAPVIPKSYIASDRQRMEVYRRLGQACTPQDVERLREELRDIFGPIPTKVQQVLESAEIRILAQRHGLKSILLQESDLIFRFSDDAKPADLFARAPGRVTITDPKTVYLRLDKTYLEPSTLLAILRKMLR